MVSSGSQYKKTTAQKASGILVSGFLTMIHWGLFAPTNKPCTATKMVEHTNVLLASSRLQPINWTSARRSTESVIDSSGERLSYGSGECFGKCPYGTFHCPTRRSFEVCATHFFTNLSHNTTLDAIWSNTVRNTESSNYNSSTKPFCSAVQSERIERAGTQSKCATRAGIQPKRATGADIQPKCTTWTGIQPERAGIQSKWIVWAGSHDTTRSVLWAANKLHTRRVYIQYQPSQRAPANFSPKYSSAKNLIAKI